jgi:hypothetical protein
MEVEANNSTCAMIVATAAPIMPRRGMVNQAIKILTSCAVMFWITWKRS